MPESHTRIGGRYQFVDVEADGRKTINRGPTHSFTVPAQNPSSRVRSAVTELPPASWLARGATLIRSAFSGSSPYVYLSSPPVAPPSRAKPHFATTMLRRRDAASVSLRTLTRIPNAIGQLDSSAVETVCSCLQTMFANRNWPVSSS